MIDAESLCNATALDSFGAFRRLTVLRLLDDDPDDLERVARFLNMTRPEGSTGADQQDERQSRIQADEQ